MFKNFVADKKKQIVDKVDKKEIKKSEVSTNFDSTITSENSNKSKNKNMKREE